MSKKAKKPKGIEAIRRRYAYIFAAPWMLGLVLFFISPVISSLRYSVSDVSFNNQGLQTKFVGLAHYKTLFFEDPYFLDNLSIAMSSILYSLPIILSLSLVFAVVLNQKFYGRTVMRALFFMSVIIPPAVLGFLSSNGAPIMNMEGGMAAAQYDFGSFIDFGSILQKLNIPKQLNSMITYLTGNVINLIWRCGVQTVLFLAGLQSIPASLYEVSKIEGANKWEEFWYVTVPSLRHVITLVLLYTTIDLFMENNAVISQVLWYFGSPMYDLPSAMVWVLFAAVVLVCGVALLLYNRFCMKRWE